MNEKKRRKIDEGVREHLGDGEVVLAAFIAQARGTTQAQMGAVNLIAGELGARKVRQHAGAAEEAGFEIGAGPRAFVVTDRRLIALELGGLSGSNVTGLLGSLPAAAVDSLEVKRFGLAQKILLTIGGTEIKLEGQSNADVKGAAEALARAKGGA